MSDFIAADFEVECPKCHHPLTFWLHTRGFDHDEKCEGMEMCYLRICRECEHEWEGAAV